MARTLVIRQGFRVIAATLLLGLVVLAGTSLADPITVVGLNWVDEDMDGVIDLVENATWEFLDPQGAQFKTRKIFQKGKDQPLFAVGIQGDLFEITMAVKESPDLSAKAHGPVTLALILAGVTAIACRRLYDRRRIASAKAGASGSGGQV